MAGLARSQSPVPMLMYHVIANPPSSAQLPELYVDPETFKARGTLAVLAVWIGKTRLIDNHDLQRGFPG